MERCNFTPCRSEKPGGFSVIFSGDIGGTLAAQPAEPLPAAPSAVSRPEGPRAARHLLPGLPERRGSRQQEPCCRGAVSRGGRAGFAADAAPAPGSRRGRAGPGLRSAPGAAGGAAGRQVNTPLGLRSVRGSEGQRGSPGPAGQPSPCCCLRVRAGARSRARPLFVFVAQTSL